MRFVQFAVQFVDFFPCPAQRFSPGGRDPVHSPAVSRASMHRFKQACPFQSVQQWVKRARSNAIAVMPKFLHHREAKDRLLTRVQQHVNANETVEEFALGFLHSNTIQAFAQFWLDLYRNSI
jgi:hypothetical protein